MSGPLIHPPIRSGSRLKAIRAEGPDGSSVALGVRDTVLGFDCEFAAARFRQEGAAYAITGTACLPTFNTASPMAHVRAVEAVLVFGKSFADAQCTVPVAALRPDEPAAFFLVTRDDSGQERSVHVYRVGAFAVPASGDSYEAVGENCFRQSKPVPMYGLGEELPLDSLVQGTVLVDP